MKHAPLIVRLRIVLSAAFAAMLSALLFAAPLVPAAPPVTLLSVSALPGPGNRTGKAIAVGNNGIFVAGVTDANNNDGILARFTLPPAAGPVWSTVWPGAANNDSYEGIALTNEGVYGAGYSYSQTADTQGGKEIKGITVKYPLAGVSPIWQAQTPAPPGGLPYGGTEGLTAIASQREGGTSFLYAAGWGEPGGGGRPFLVKLNTAGGMIWTRADTASGSFGQSLAVATLNGFIYVAGHKADTGVARPFLKKYDPAGNLIWQRNSAVDFPYVGECTAICASGNALYLVGFSFPGASYDFQISRWDEAGNKVWAQGYDRFTGDDELYGCAVIGNYLYATGFTTGGSAGGKDGVILQLDPATGGLQNSILYGGGGNESFGGAATDGNDLYVVGTAPNGGLNELRLLRYSVSPILTSIAVTPANPYTIIGSSQAFTATGTYNDASAGVLNPPNGTWRMRTPLPDPLGYFQGAALGGILYATGSSGTPTRLDAYDPAANLWSAKQGMSVARQIPGVGSANGRLYVVGGFDGVSYHQTLEEYNPGTNTWTTKTPMPTPRMDPAVVELGGLLYVIGGYFAGTTPVVEAYDPVAGTWAPKAPLLTPRQGPAVGVLNGRIYVAGGGSGAPVLSSVEVYDPATDTWAAGAPMSAPRADASAGVIDGLFYVFGGTNGASINAGGEAYDPTTNLWSAVQPLMPVPTNISAAAVIGGRLYIAGGSNGPVTYDVLQEFSPGGGLFWTSGAPTATIDLISGRALGVSAGPALITAQVGAIGGSTTLTVQTRLQAVARLKTTVQALVPAGLNSRYALLLAQVLDQATARLNQGNPAAAAALLRTFTAYVNNFIGSGALSAANGQPLLDQAAALIANLTN